jgi:hypothetical protein
MQKPTEEADTSISAENAREDPNLNGTFIDYRKAAKRNLPWDLASRELYLAEDIPATKKPRLEEPISAPTDEAAVNTSLRGTEVNLPADADANLVDADADPVNDNWAIDRWTPEEDAKLKSAMANTCKKKYGKEYKTDWGAIPTLVSGRTKIQCCSRWQDIFNSHHRPGDWTYGSMDR